ncbi:hypothetical protein ACWDE0_41875 [Streptomyces sp. 900105755]
MGLWDVLPDSERQQWIFDPFVSVGPLRLGMTSDEASAALGGVPAASITATPGTGYTGRPGDDRPGLDRHADGGAGNCGSQAARFGARGEALGAGRQYGSAGTRRGGRAGDHPDHHRRDHRVGGGAEWVGDESLGATERGHVRASVPVVYLGGAMAWGRVLQPWSR